MISWFGTYIQPQYNAVTKQIVSAPLAYNTESKIVVGRCFAGKGFSHVGYGFVANNAAFQWLELYVWGLIQTEYDTAAFHFISIGY